MKSAIVHYKAMLLAYAGVRHVIAHNLTEIIDIKRLGGTRAGKAEFEKLSARDQEAVSTGTVSKTADYGCVVIDAHRCAGG